MKHDIDLPLKIINMIQLWSSLGHGDEQYLLCSDYNQKTGEGRYKRDTFEKYFNGDAVSNKCMAYKFFFVDSCRGQADSQVFDIRNNNNNLYGPKGDDSIFSLFIAMIANFIMVGDGETIQSIIALWGAVMHRYTKDLC